jgi:hypothetical protein
LYKGKPAAKIEGQASLKTFSYTLIMSFATFSLLAALAATTVSAHGYVNNASIGGVEYTVSALLNTSFA